MALFVGFYLPWRSMQLFLLALVSVRAQNVTSLTTVRPTDSVFQWIGRTAIVNTQQGYNAVMYDMPGVEVRFRVQGTRSVSALIQQNVADGPTGVTSSCTNPWSGNRLNNFLVFQDGIRIVEQRQELNPGTSCWYCTFDTGVHNVSSEVNMYQLVTGLDISKEYEIRLSKDSEADFASCEPWPNWVMLHGILIEEGAEILAPLAPANAPAKIEIIGGSAASGRCDLCGKPWTAPVSTEEERLQATSLHKSWVGQLCGPHGMDADCHITAWSGMGITSSLDANADVHLPQVFRRTVQTLPDDGNQWNFSLWRPDVVVLDLGLEDAGVMDQPGEFQQEYIKLVLNLAEWYGPHVKIIAGCGTTTTSYCQEIREVVLNRTLDAICIDYLALDRGGLNHNSCCGFPDRDTHENLMSVVRSKVERVIADRNCTKRSSRGPFAAIITLLCICLTAAFFLIWQLVRKCTGTSRARAYSIESDESEERQVPFRRTSELSARR